MVENWIKVESTPTYDEIKEEGSYDGMLCKLIFQGKVNVTLDDDDVNYLLSELLMYRWNKDLFESFMLGLIEIK